MKVITKVIWYECEGRIAEVAHETVVGEDFVGEDGERICIGMTEEVQKILGLPFNALKDQKETITSLYASNFELFYELLRVRQVGILGRLKFLFTKKL